MDFRHSINAVPYQAAVPHPSFSRILTSCTANIRPYALDSHEGIEHQNPYASVTGSVKPAHGPESQPPIPQFKLGSNDQHAQNIARLQARRQHNRERATRSLSTDPSRPYLQHPKYLQYRARQRCDTGPDGKPVWDDRIEEAFQNALVNIEPMGRRKKSQRGRPHGRNELISEWIQQETGEYRSRKQVSSHIQVLNSLLKGIPEWDALTTPDDRAMTEQSSSKCSSTSIEQKTGEQRRGGAASSFYGPNVASTSSPSAGGLSDDGLVDGQHLTKLSFAMWVSPPNQMEQVLHTYTRSKSDDSTIKPILLDEVTNWQSLFPTLRPIIDKRLKLREKYDITLLDTSIELMGEFPPRFSKLGIALELDFGRLANSIQWTCVTKIFQSGQLDHISSHAECQVTEVGRVKPFFESKWWAATLTQLAERRRIAEDGSVEAANKAIRNFFQSLRVVQEISADIVESTASNEARTTHARRKRMAILLWRFSEAPPNRLGTTTWQRVIVPAELNSSHSPPPIDEMLLDRKNVEKDVAHGHENSPFQGGDKHYLPDEAATDYNSCFDVALGDRLCQGEFLSYSPEGGLSCFELLQPSFHMPGTSPELDASINVSANVLPQDTSQFQDHNVPATANYFEFSAGAGLRHSGPSSFDMQPDSASDFGLETYSIGHDDWNFPVVPPEERSSLSLPPPSIPQSPADPGDEPFCPALLAPSSMRGPSSNHSAPESRSQTVAPRYGSITSAPSNNAANTSAGAPMSLYSAFPPSSAPRIYQQSLQSYVSSRGVPSHWSSDGLPYHRGHSPHSTNSVSSNADNAVLGGHVGQHPPGQSGRDGFERLLAYRSAYATGDLDGRPADTPVDFPVLGALGHGQRNSSIYDSGDMGQFVGLHLLQQQQQQQQHLTDAIRDSESPSVLMASATASPMGSIDGRLRGYRRKDDSMQHELDLEDDEGDVPSPRAKSVESAE